MIDWAIIGGGLIFVAWVGWLAFRPRKRKDDERPIVMADTLRYVQPQVPSVVNQSADEIAARVYLHEREQERRERAETLLSDVWLGQRPNEEDIKLLSEYFDARRVNAAMINGMWASLTDAINDCTIEIEALKAAPPTLVVAEMPERVG